MFRVLLVGMNPETNRCKTSVTEKLAHLADDVKRSATEVVDEAGSKIGGALENANERAADLKHRVEHTYDETVSPKIDAAQVQISGLFILVLIAFLYVSKPVLLPVILALILMLIFRPLHVVLTQRCKMPSSLSALLIVLVVSAGMFSAGYFLADPASSYLSRLQEKGVQDRLLKVFAPIKQAHEGITKVTEKVETITDAPSKEEAETEGEFGKVDSGEEGAIVKKGGMNDQSYPVGGDHGEIFCLLMLCRMSDFMIDGTA